MPRLPTMRVIGSHAMSTRLPLPSRCVAAGMVDVIVTPSPGSPGAGQQVAAALSPLRLLVERADADAAEAADDGAVRADGGRGGLAAGRLVHERHELVREAGHRA